MNFDLMPWAHLHRLHQHFRTFYWLHPQSYDSVVSVRGLRKAIRNGDLFECQRRPWLTASPALFFALRGQAPMGSQWHRLLRGPAAHESFVLRTASRVKDWPGARIKVDEAIREVSLPGAWGGVRQLVPDVEVIFDDLLLPSLWIECERTLRGPDHYSKRLLQISRHLVVYVVHGERQRMRLAERLGLTQTPQRRQGRVRVLTELQWRHFARRYGRAIGKSNEQLNLVALTSGKILQR